MCLTESQAGTDLGWSVQNLNRGRWQLRRYRHKDLHHRWRAGLTENIIHLVLARLPNAPPGVRHQPVSGAKAAAG